MKRETGRALLKLTGHDGQRLFAPVPSGSEELRRLLAALLRATDVDISLVNERDVTPQPTTEEAHQ